MDLTALLRERCLSLFMDVSFPPLMIPRPGITFTVCLTVWLGSRRSCVPQAVGMGEKEIHQGCYSQGARVFSITFSLSYLKFNTPMTEVSLFMPVEVRSVSVLTCTCTYIFTRALHVKNVKTILLVFKLQSEIYW